MPHYLLTYRGPKGYQPSSDTAPQWRTWFEGMGDSLVDLGNPVAASANVGNCDSSSTELGGYSVVDAADLQEVKEIAAGCPHLEVDGGVEIAEILPITPTP